MGDENLQITLEIEGKDAEEGHLRLNDFLDYMEALKSALESVDKTVGSSRRTSVYYRVVDARHENPLSITIEPVRKAKRPITVNLKERHALFFRLLVALREGNGDALDIDSETLQAFYRLAGMDHPQFKRAAIFNHAANVELDADFRARIGTLLEKETHSFGTVAGHLDTLNLHGNPAFWIYPRVGPNRIFCRFKRSDEAKALRCMKSFVIVHGKKAFRPNANFPHRVEVESFEPAQKGGVSLLDLAGSVPDDGVDSVETIRRIRDEWE